MSSEDQRKKVTIDLNEKDDDLQEIRSNIVRALALDVRAQNDKRADRSEASYIKGSYIKGSYIKGSYIKASYIR